MDFLTDPITGDLKLEGYQLATDDTIRTAVLLSLQSDARHEQERGFWAESLIHAEARFGSRLWTLKRAKLQTQSLEVARQYALEALAWLVEDGYATTLEVSAQRLSQGVLLVITLAGQTINITV